MRLPSQLMHTRQYRVMQLFLALKIRRRYRCIFTFLGALKSVRIAILIRTNHAIKYQKSVMWQL